MDSSGEHHFACLFCTQNCYRTHGEGKPVGPTVPTFCKIVTQSIVAENNTCPFLELPAAFVRRYKDELCKTAVLEGPSGKTWSVDVSASECVLKFQNGWRAFSLDHNLHEGDVVLFKLTTKAYFIVKIFDKAGCEKDLGGVQKTSAFALENKLTSSRKCKKRIHHENNFLETADGHLNLDELPNTCHLVAGGKKLSFDLETGEDEKIGLYSVPGVGAARSENNKKLKSLLLKGLSALNPVYFHGSDPDSDDMNLLQDLIMRCRKTNAAFCEEVAGSSSMPLTTLKQVIRSGSSNRKLFLGGEHIHVTQKSPKPRLFGKNSSCVRVVSDAMATAKSYESTNPTIIKEMSHSHVNYGFWLTLGRSFARTWLPLKTTQAILVTSTGDRWEVNLLWPRGGFSGGWRKFSKDHGLQEKDVCLFEIINQAPFVFMVHMFRQA